MEVMNSDLFSQNETLVGQAGKTRAMGVSDDPMLMSMLSTGFYANPLRTMIQEVMFNAWDAHRMGGCLNKPIDIYINETSGLIIRDYGPGISDEDMVPVYCIYGASTKRKDKRQTGGFGLGCKSPFSYTESFNVTSHHNGVKSMYLVSRVSDDAEGKPGLTPLFSVPSEETGLLVTIPLEAQHQSRAYNYIKDVLYLSGIKAQIHFDYEEGEYVPELVESKEMAVGEYVMDDRDKSPVNKVFAVYGGVRYHIPEHEEYLTEFRFINMISEIKPLYIGFAPDTLTPLPNREGLNMSNRTKENIRIGLEVCMELFQDVFEPLVQAYIRQNMDKYKTMGVQAPFAMYHALTLSAASNSQFLNKFEQQMKELVPLNTDKTVWEIGLRLLCRNPAMIMEIIGKKRWITIICKHFLRCYPTETQIAFAVMKKDPDSMISTHRRNVSGGFISDLVMGDQVEKLFTFEKALKAEFPNNTNIQRMQLRVPNEGKFVVTSRTRTPEPHVPRKMSAAERILNKGKTFERKRPAHLEPRKLWDKEGDEIRNCFLSNVVILAKTVTALNDTAFRYSDYFYDSTTPLYGYQMHDFLFSDHGFIPAYSVPTHKGGYDKALEILTNLGYEVIEADEPVKKRYARGETSKMSHQYRRLNTRYSNWQAHMIDDSDEDYDPKEDGIPLIEPTHFLYVRESDIPDKYYSYDYDKPSKSVIAAVMKNHPDVAMVHNVTQAKILESKGVKPLSDLINPWYKGLHGKKQRFRNMIRARRILHKTNIDIRILKDVNMQKAFHMAVVSDPKDPFWEDVGLITDACEDYYRSSEKNRKELTALCDTTWTDDPMRDRIKKVCKNFEIFNSTRLTHVWHGRDEQSRQDLVKSVVRMMRTM